MKMKKTFNDIMNENLNEDFSNVRDYADAYNAFERKKLNLDNKDRGRYYTKQTINTDNDKAPETPKTSEELDAEREDQELTEKCMDYIKKTDELKRRYSGVVRTAHLKIKKLEKEFNKLNPKIGSREETHPINNKGDTEIIEKQNNRYEAVEKEINELEDAIDKYGHIFEDRLDKLNASLDEKVKAKLQVNGKYVSSLRRSLDESFENQEIKNLSNQEEALIFGESFTNILDIIAINEGGTVMSTRAATASTEAQKAENSAAAKFYQAQIAQSKGRGTASDTHNAEMQLKAAKGNRVRVQSAMAQQVTDPVSGISESIMQEAGEVQMGQAEGIERRIVALQNQKDRLEDQTKKKTERIDQSIEKYNMVKQNLAAKAQQLKTSQKTVTENDESLMQKIESINDPKEQVSSTISGKKIEAREIKNLDESKGSFIDFGDSKKEPSKVESFTSHADFSKMLFNGASGDALNYFINGTINNQNIKEIQVAKYMQTHCSELEPVLKKIRYYLRRTASGLDYDQYLDLKLQKTKFKSLFTEYKKKYDDRYKI